MDAKLVVLLFLWVSGVSLTSDVWAAVRNSENDTVIIGTILIRPCENANYSVCGFVNVAADVHLAVSKRIWL